MMKEKSGEVKKECGGEKGREEARRDGWRDGPLRSRRGIPHTVQDEERKKYAKSVDHGLLRRLAGLKVASRLRVTESVHKSTDLELEPKRTAGQQDRKDSGKPAALQGRPSNVLV